MPGGGVFEQRDKRWVFFYQDYSGMFLLQLGIRTFERVIFGYSTLQRSHTKRDDCFQKNSGFRMQQNISNKKKRSI